MFGQRLFGYALQIGLRDKRFIDRTLIASVGVPFCDAVKLNHEYFRVSAAVGLNFKPGPYYACIHYRSFNLKYIPSELHFSSCCFESNTVYNFSIPFKLHLQKILKV